ncbi:MAG: hypothetical protein RL619_80 [Bacteroidota bacterium]
MENHKVIKMLYAIFVEIFLLHDNYSRMIVVVD